MENKAEFKKALQIGVICIFSYMVSYYMRNMLSVSTPEMLASGTYTTEFIGLLSSVYFFVYAIGQLINGIIGDTVKPKYMVVSGMFICGVVSALFAFIDNKVIQILCFAVMGFALSMLRGPLVKTISENMSGDYARICCVFLSFASFLGPLIASLFSLIFEWKMAFVVSGITSMLMGIIAYTVLSILEKKNLITYRFSKQGNSLKNVFKVFKLEKFIFYMILGALVEISTASINFWLPTYFSERLGFSPDTSNMIFSVVTFIKASIPFISLYVFRLFKKNDIRMSKCVFLLSAVLFMVLLTNINRYLNIIILLLALMSVGCASTLLWSIYIPSQGESGLVSTINGVLDFTGYLAASIANIIFSYALTYVGWNGIIVIWSMLMLVGVAVSFTVKNK